MATKVRSLFLFLAILQLIIITTSSVASDRKSEVSGDELPEIRVHEVKLPRPPDFPESRYPSGYHVAPPKPTE